MVNNLLFLVYDIIEFAGRILNVPQCYIRATNFHKDNLWVLLLLRSQNLSYWNLNLFLDYFVIFDSGLGHSAIFETNFNSWDQKLIQTCVKNSEGHSDIL